MNDHDLAIRILNVTLRQDCTNEAADELVKAAIVLLERPLITAEAQR